MFPYLIFQMRVWVLKRRKLKNSLRFSFLSLVTRWFADILSQLLCYKNWFGIYYRTLLLKKKNER